MKIWEKLSSTIWLLNFDYLPDGNGKKVDAKNEKKMMMMKRTGRVKLIFEFSISKFGSIEIFMKIWEKKMDQFLKTFLTNWGKNEN